MKSKPYIIKLIIPSIIILTTVIVSNYLSENISMPQTNIEKNEKFLIFDKINSEKIAFENYQTFSSEKVKVLSSINNIIYSERKEEQINVPLLDVKELLNDSDFLPPEPDKQKEIKVQLIIPEEGIVVINDKTYKLKDDINGYVISEISKSKICLNKQKEKKCIKIFN